jgi:hypothetical protein
VDRDDDLLELETGTGERICLSRSFVEMASSEIDDIVEFVNGSGTRFPPFQVPTYEGEQGLVEVEPGRLEERGWYGGVEETRLFQFAHLARPFDWTSDPRRDLLEELVHRAKSPAGSARLKKASKQDLWDAMFVFARGARFVEGLFAANTEGLTAVANEIRERLLFARDRR